ncbi:hypothetical protein ABFX02_02G131500 [Erythranthe guttata]
MTPAPHKSSKTTIMARTNMVFLPCIALIFTVISVSDGAGFTVDLIHRDSLRPHSDVKVQDALQRSFNRAKSLVNNDINFPQLASTEIVSDRGEYLMKISLGTPAVETLAIADTGSDLTWIQCKPCISCFKQNSPIFDPKGSSTYKQVSCSSTTCTSLQRSSCNSTTGTCLYTMMYGDRSYSKGDLATEKITLKGVSIPNVIIGCGHVDQGTFGAGASGIVGLGGGRESLITQMGSSIEGKFSYCLVPFLSGNAKSSKMNFGENAVVSGAGVVSTPIVEKTPKTFYYLTLEGLTVGKQRLDVSSLYGSNASEEGNMIIDSGTTLTFLPSDLYYQVVTAVKSQVKLKQISDPQGVLNLCYLSTGEVPQVPAITAHFKGADVKLKTVNTFIRTGDNSLCFAFAPATSFGIYGNVAQMNFLVGYDLKKKTVSFKPTDCSKA